MDIIVLRDLRMFGIDYGANKNYTVSDSLGLLMVNSGFAKKYLPDTTIASDVLNTHSAQHDSIKLFRRLGNKPVSFSATAYAFGDSLSRYLTNYGASDAAHMYISLFKAKHPEYLTWIEMALPGGTIYNMITGIGTQTAFVAGDLCIGLLGTNDARNTSPYPANRYDLERYAASYLAFLAVPEAYKVRAVNRNTNTINPAITATVGSIVSLNAVAAAGFSIALYNNSAQANDQISFSVPAGDTLYLWVWKGVNIYLNSIRITVDGDDVTSGGYYNSVQIPGTTFFPAMIRITGLPNTTHVVKLTALGVAIPFIFQCAACFDSSAVQGTNVIVGGTIPQDPLSTTWGVAQYPAPAGAGTSSSAALVVTGVGSLFTQQVGIGWLVANAGYTQIKTVTAVSSDTSLTTDTAFSPALAAEVVKFISPNLQQNYQRGATDNFWSQIVKKIAGQLKRDGLNVFYSDVVADFDVRGHLYTDLVHMNDQGNNHAFKKIENTYQTGNE